MFEGKRPGLKLPGECLSAVEARERQGRRAGSGGYMMSLGDGGKLH